MKYVRKYRFNYGYVLNLNLSIAGHGNELFFLIRKSVPLRMIGMKGME